MDDRTTTTGDANMSPKNTARSRRRKALTRVEILVILVISLLIVSMFLVLGMRARLQQRRTVCAANLKGIGTAIYLHDSENSQYWPIAAHAPAVEDGKGLVTYAPDKIGSHRGNANDPMAGETTDQDTEMSTTRNLWILIRWQVSLPDWFICPSSNDVCNDEDHPGIFWDFRNWHEASYGYQVPYGKRGRPSTDRDPRMPLLADKGPFGASLEANKPNPGVPTAKMADQYDDWKPWNSPNHCGEGQNVLSGDGHAEWCQTPMVGIEQDNIYTRWSDATGGVNGDWKVRGHGTPPTSNETPFSNSDTLIYP